MQFSVLVAALAVCTGVLASPASEHVQAQQTAQAAQAGQAGQAGQAAQTGNFWPWGGVYGGVGGGWGYGYGYNPYRYYGW
ncbi:hypothetical protein PCANC_05273 [Puccinia coronata f. sp. avenae]|uniref:Uncharacterized protein n=1 Tax=Puccinia coronata f. sp. avenae TaxID=200324 RepID=A0A2N5VYM7_9BASI|nr:hypothetical protein PCANC_22329 [Puccinia coronata f. sp. avenae]PLW48177.1 hypothetical protein PCASD_03294 [Puccinia coronata f. sp. avenae]PLW55104.1 hypothetical protein PCANC_05273 [Puccinia coronata f. sp. avenae]